MLSYIFTFKKTTSSLKLSLKNYHQKAQMYRSVLRCKWSRLSDPVECSSLLGRRKLKLHHRGRGSLYCNCDCR